MTLKDSHPKLFLKAEHIEEDDFVFRELVKELGIFHYYDYESDDCILDLIYFTWENEFGEDGYEWFSKLFNQQFPWFKEKIKNRGHSEYGFWREDRKDRIAEKIYKKYFHKFPFDQPIDFLIKINEKEYIKLNEHICLIKKDKDDNNEYDDVEKAAFEEIIDRLQEFKKKFVDWFYKNKVKIPKTDIPPINEEEKIKRNLLRWDGAKWFIRFNGIEKSVDNIKGMHIIAHLISQQGSSIRSDVIYDDLFANIIDKDKIRSDMFEDDLMKDEGLSNGANNTEKIKYVTRKSITIINNERIKREDELEKALIEQKNHLAEKLEWELKELNDWLGKCSDNQGRPRKIPDRLERARKALFGVITTAKNNIKKYHSDVFYNHLDNYLKTGGYSTYHPKTPVDWEVIK